MIATAVGFGVWVVASAVEVDMGVGACGVSVRLGTGTSRAVGTSVVVGVEAAAHSINVSASKVVEVQRIGRMALTGAPLEILVSIPPLHKLGSYLKEFVCELTAAS